MRKIALTSIILMMLCTAFAEKIGYALSGGGARGFAHIGVLKVLEEEGLKPDYISGTSIGAIIGALSAMGYSATDIQHIATEIDWNDVLQDRVNRCDLYIGQKRWAPYGNVVFELDDKWLPQLPSAVFKVNSLNLQLFDLVAASGFEQDFSRFPIPFTCVATDLVTGAPKVFSSGSLLQALRASVSIPSILPPFQVGENYYIDGGISQNLPITQVQDMGANLVVGIKVNSSLRAADQLNSIVDILDQTINIGITRNLSENLDSCDLLLEPDLLQYSSGDFKHVDEIIAIGENYARQHIAKIRAFIAEADVSPADLDFVLYPDWESFYVKRIEVLGNKYLSSAKIREYSGLSPRLSYSRNEIINACRNAWNSQYFNVLYPDLIPLGDGGYLLNIHVSERKPKTVALNNSYNDVEKLTASAVLSLENLLLKNSQFIAGLLLGGKNELNVDYVKNFGDFWGVYYRIFPYINEKTLYVYDTDHYQINSVKSLEWGGTTGIGVFTKDIAIAELFAYYSETRLYRGISESDMPPRRYAVSGLGIKAYHESLDDYTFPYSGVRIIGKLNFARDEKLSDYVYNSLRGKVDAYIPLCEDLSIKIGANSGTYFDSTPTDIFDPFAIGGIDGFKGYSRYEVSAPHYLIFELGLSAQILRSLHLQAGIQGLTYDDDTFLNKDIQGEYCLYAGIGYDTLIAPLRLQFATNKQGSVNSMLSLGFDFDIFEFSRK
jgi:NTE family protein